MLQLQIQKTLIARIYRVGEGTGVDYLKATGKAKGWFFSHIETVATEPAGILIGQLHDDSCAAACVRMLAADEGIHQPEAYLRHLLKTDKGTFLSRIPATLSSLGLRKPYLYIRDLKLYELQKATTRGGVWSRHNYRESDR